MFSQLKLLIAIAMACALSSAVLAATGQKKPLECTVFWRQYQDQTTWRQFASLMLAYDFVQVMTSIYTWRKIWQNAIPTTIIRVPHVVRITKPRLLSKRFHKLQQQKKMTPPLHSLRIVDPGKYKGVGVVGYQRLCGYFSSGSTENHNYKKI